MTSVWGCAAGTFKNQQPSNVTFVTARTRNLPNNPSTMADLVAGLALRYVEIQKLIQRLIRKMRVPIAG
jgi:hypothetical protein